ncbi:HTH_Tnp_Tc3_2 domain-containing protein [Trichonephila clavipes]|nr:HTH_Tnp_Tc3_2 domain-containing protein [Trichonephila clavipes]
MAQMKHLDDFFYAVELLDNCNVDVPSWKYPRNLESEGFGNDSKMMLLPKETDGAQHQTCLVSSLQLPVRQFSRQTVYRCLGHIGLYARRPVRCVPLTATHCRLRLTWSREHALWTPQQWSCVMFSDESRFSLQSDSAGLKYGERQSVTMTGHIYRNVILEQHVRLFRAAMGAEFLFMDDNARPHHANIVDECLQSEDITRMD